MNNIIKKKQIIEAVALAESDNFKYDEDGILSEYQAIDKNTSSLTIKILSIFGGLLATLCFFGFIAIINLFESAVGLLFLGVLLIVFSLCIDEISKRLITDTLSISLYVTGIILLAFGLVQLEIDENMVILIIMCLSLLTIYITQNQVISFISFITVSGCLIAFIFNNVAYNLIHFFIGGTAIGMAYWCLNEGKIISSYIRLSRLYDTIRIGLLFSLITGLLANNSIDLFQDAYHITWLSSFILIPTLLYVLWEICQRNDAISNQRRNQIIGLSLLILLPTVFEPAISGSLLIIILCFYVNYKVGFSISILTLLYFISRFYYDLQFTLLTKSIILMTSGVLFILFYYFIRDPQSHENI